MYGVECARLGVGSGLGHSHSAYDERATIEIRSGDRNPLLASGEHSSHKNIITIPIVKLLRKIGALQNSDKSLVEGSVRQWLGLQGQKEPSPAFNPDSTVC